MKKKSRGRPRKFDESEVLDKILDVFWQQGYAATSLDDISAAANLNRPSLYSAFGDKKSIYQAVLNRFTKLFLKDLELALNNDDSLRSDLISFYNAALLVYQPNKKINLGCPVLSNAITETYLNEVIRDDISSALAKIDKLLERRFELAIEKDELGADKNPKLLSQIAASILHSLAIRVRAQQNRFAYKKFIEDSVNELIED